MGVSFCVFWCEDVLLCVLVLVYGCLDAEMVLCLYACWHGHVCVCVDTGVAVCLCGWYFSFLFVLVLVWVAFLHGGLFGCVLVWMWVWVCVCVDVDVGVFLHGC